MPCLWATEKHVYSTEYLLLGATYNPTRKALVESLYQFSTLVPKSKKLKKILLDNYGVQIVKTWLSINIFRIVLYLTGIVSVMEVFRYLCSSTNSRVLSGISPRRVAILSNWSHISLFHLRFVST